MLRVANQMAMPTISGTSTAAVGIRSRGDSAGGRGRAHLGGRSREVGQRLGRDLARVQGARRRQRRRPQVVGVRLGAGIGRRRLGLRVPVGGCEHD